MEPRSGLRGAVLIFVTTFIVSGVVTVAAPHVVEWLKEQRRIAFTTAADGQLNVALYELNLARASQRRGNAVHANEHANAASAALDAITTLESSYELAFGYEHKRDKLLKRTRREQIVSEMPRNADASARSDAASVGKFGRLVATFDYFDALTALKEETGLDDGISRLRVALLYSHLVSGEPSSARRTTCLDRAVESLERALEMRPDLKEALDDPCFATLLEDPRIQRLVAR